jgi:ATP-dependent DNA helicase RecQ
MAKVADYILDNVNIVDIISRRVTLKRIGSNFSGLSPFQNEKVWSFMVSPKKQIFKDFRSGIWWNVITFVMEYEKVNFMDAIKIIAEEQWLEISKYINTSNSYKNFTDEKEKIKRVHINIKNKNQKDIKLLFIDIEVNTQGKIQMIWAVDEESNNIYKWNDIKYFNTLVEKYDILVGHNILNHDLEYLVKDRNIDLSIINKPIIDTLWLSSLIYIKKPYHNLVKDYKIDKVNDPIEDAKLCAKVFQDCCDRFLWKPSKAKDEEEQIDENKQNLDTKIQIMLYSLLKDTKQFKSFFDYLIKKGIIENTIIDIKREIEWELWEFIKKDFFWQPLKKILENSKLEFVYILRLFYLRAHMSKDIAIFPSWIVYNLPNIHNIFQEIFKYKSYDLRRELKERFGYDDFRKFPSIDGHEISQEEVVKAALNKEDFLTVFATWWWKSLTFQLPAIIMAEQFPYLTIIISPLISLMKDQVYKLDQKHHIVNAWFINSSLDPIERKDIYEKVEFWWIDLLYLSPEILRNKTIQTLLSKRFIDRIIIDEAHCFSKRWHDFRIDYMFIADFINELAKKNKSLENVSISCFTATAKQDVSDEIKKYFKDKLFPWRELKEFKSGSKREKLKYSIIETDTEEERFKSLIDILENKVLDKSCIIFTRYTWYKTNEFWNTLDTNREWSARFVAEKINEYFWNENYCKNYSGNMKTNEKNEIQNNFDNWNLKTIVATNAFGMWVDKKDVRYVIHYWIPSSVENYLQEAWRAWRDWEEAECIILYNKNDINENLQLNKSWEVKRKEIKSLLSTIKNRFKKLNEKWKTLKDKWLTKSAKEFVDDAWWISKDKFEESFHKAKSIWTIKVTTALYFLEKFKFIKRSFNLTRIWATANKKTSLVDELKKIETIPGLDNEEKEITKTIYKKIRESEAISIEDLWYLVGRHFKSNMEHPKKWIEELVRLLQNEEFIENDEELLIFLNTNSDFTSLQILNDILVVINEISAIFSENIQMWQKMVFDKIQINTKVSKALWKTSVMQEIDSFLSFLKQNQYISISEGIDFKKDWTAIKKEIKNLRENGYKLINFLLQWFSKNQKESKNLPIKYKLNELTQDFGKYINLPLDIKWLENILKFLHKFEIIRVEWWLFLYHKNFQILEWDELYSKQLEKEKHYSDLEDFYIKKIEQAHIMDEFAQKIIKNEDINKYVDEYFNLDYNIFLEKYFKNRLWEIRRPISKKKFDEIYEKLNQQQQEILKSKDNLLIIAWPWSGKTTSLVHKAASLIMEDGINKQEFLFLSFSRSAKMQIKEKIVELIGPQWYFLDINTFDWYAFKLLQREPTEEDFIRTDKNDKDTENNSIIKQAIKYLQENKSLQLPYSVLVLDEFQDINDDNFNLIQLIQEKSSKWKEKWEKMNIIATWDDDQSIYWWRNGNIEYIQNFQNKNNAQKIVLDTNYRSTQKLIDFTTKFITTCSNRQKEWTKLISNRDKEEWLWVYNTTIETRDCEGNYLYGVINAVKKIYTNDSSTAIICHDNITWFYINSILKSAWYKTKILLWDNLYNIKNIIEIKEFMNLCLDKDNLVNEKNVEDKYNQVTKQFWDNKNTIFLRRIIDDILLKNQKINQHILKDYICWLEEDDLMNTEDKKYITISTFHKAKWREFDNVIIYFDPNKNWLKNSDDDKRLIYVGMTRARNNLIILWKKTNNDYFSSLYDICENKQEYIFDTNDNKWLELITSCEDIYLPFNLYRKNQLFDIDQNVEVDFKNKDYSKRICFQIWKTIIQTSTSKFKDKITNLLQKWYKIEQVKIYQRIIYKLKKEQKDSLNYLFKIKLKK